MIFIAEDVNLTRNFMMMMLVMIGLWRYYGHSGPRSSIYIVKGQRSQPMRRQRVGPLTNQGTQVLSQKLECLEDSDIHHGDIVSSLPSPPWSAIIMMSLSEWQMSPAYCSALDPLSCPIWSMPHFSNHLSAFQLNIMECREGTDLQRCWWKLEALCLFYQSSLSTVIVYTVLLYQNWLIVGRERSYVKVLGHNRHLTKYSHYCAC